MNSYEVAEWLNEKATDEQFAEVFGYLDLMRSGRKVSEDSLNKTTMINTNIDGITQWLNKCLYEIIPKNSDIDCGAWWKL